MDQYHHLWISNCAINGVISPTEVVGGVLQNCYNDTVYFAKAICNVDIYADKQNFVRDESAIVLVRAGRKFGKALDINTPIPTPKGFTTMGKLGVGDVIYGGDGRECKVLNCTDVMYNHKCYSRI